MSTARRFLLLTFTAGAASLLFSGCAAPSEDRPPAGGRAGSVASESLNPEQARQIASEAYVYLYPMVQNYQTIYQFALNPSGPEYKGPVNQVHNVARVFTYQDTTIVTANSDTPYSYVIMDLRAEPIVITMPAIEPERYYSLQIVDLYTHNVDYLGTRRDGNGGGDFLIAGPDWRGTPPPGIKRTITLPTQLVFTQFRTQLFDPADLANVKRVQDQYKARSLSQYRQAPPPVPPPKIAYPPINLRDIDKNFWQYANFLLQFAPPLKGEEPLRERMARIGVVANGIWPPPGMSPALLGAVDEGAEDARRQLEAEVTKLTTSVGLFGTPELMAGKYRQRALGALGGIYGNDAEETIYPSYQTDSSGKPLDTSKSNYTITFAKGQLPPVDAFWSVTMYDARSRLMIKNPLDRYLVNSSMLQGMKKDTDGGVTLYLQHASPGPALETNWLPAPDGPMSAVMRLYLPRPEIIKGDWKPPAIRTTGPG